MDTTHFIGFFLRILRISLHFKFPSNSQDFTTPQQLFYKTTPHERSENSPFSRNLVAAERKRRRQSGVMWTEYHKRSDANYIGWINLIQINKGSWGCRKVTLIPSPLKWLLQASLGAFPFTVWKNWRWGIHESFSFLALHSPKERKRNSKRESSRKSSKNQRLFSGANLFVRPA